MAQFIRFTNAYPSAPEFDNTTMINMDHVVSMAVEQFEVSGEPQASCTALRIHRHPSADYVAYLGEARMPAETIDARLAHLTGMSSIGPRRVVEGAAIWSPKRDGVTSA